MTERRVYDFGPLPPPTETDANWANRTWSSLTIRVERLGIEGGSWDMPSVGRYRRTGPQELTLTEIHGSRQPDHIGVTMWNKHDWICFLAEAIGWVIIDDKVETADEEEVPRDRDEAPIEHIGKVFACECGMVYTILGPQSGETRFLVPSDGDCLNPSCNIVIPHPHAGVLNTVNDTAVIAKHDAQELLKIAIDEDEYPAPPIEAAFETQGEIFSEYRHEAEEE